MTKYPDAAFYVVDLEDTIKDVVSIELVYALYEKVNTDRFVNMIVREAVTDCISNCNIASRSFTQLPMLSDITEYTAHKFRSIKVFDGGPLAKLGRLTIAFASPSTGALYPMRDHLLRFEITCDASGGGALGPRYGVERGVTGGAQGSYRVFSQ